MFITLNSEPNVESWKKGEAVLSSVRLWTNVEDLLSYLRERYKLVSGMYSNFETYLSIRNSVFYVSANNNVAPCKIEGRDLVEMARALDKLG